MRDKKEAEAAIEKVRDAIEELAQMVFDEEGTDLVEQFLGAPRNFSLSSFLKKDWFKEL